MKRLFRFIASLAVAATAMISCQKEVAAPVAEYTYTFALSNPETKAFLATEGVHTFTKWEAGDQLGVYTVGTPGTSYNRYADINATANPVVFQISSFYALSAGDKVYCYFPYASGNSQDPATVSLSIPAEQNGKMNNMPMVSTPYTMTSDVAAKTEEPISDINMMNLGGVFQFRVYSTEASYRSETVKSVKFTADTDIAGSFTFDIRQNANLAINGNAGRVITVSQDASVGADKENGGVVNMVVKPGSYTGTLVVSTDAATYTYSITSAKSVERSHVKPLNVNLATGVRVACKTVTQTSFSAVSGNLDNDPNISFLATKGSGTTAPIVSSNKIRIYKPKSGETTGGILTISANNGAKILSVAVTSNRNNCFSVAVDGSSSSADKTGSGPYTYTVSNINADAVSFTNIFSDSNDISKIVVTYSGGAAPAIVQTITAVPQSGLDPSLGTYNIDDAYSVTNIDEDAEQIDITTSANISNVTAYGGSIEFDMEPNYGTTTADGTITLTLHSDPSVTATINVQQSSSTMSTSETEIVIPAAGDEASFNLTCKYFGWNMSSDNDEELIYNPSGSGSNDPQRITIQSTVEATEEVQTIGTITIVRNGNASDPQKKTVVVKKAAATPAGAPTVLYTLDATDSNNNGTNNAYANAGTKTVDGIEWSFQGNMTQNPWRIGGKNISNTDRTVYTKTAFDKALTSIDLTVGAASSITVNSLTLYYDTHADFSAASSINKTFAANSTISFAPDGGFPENCFYKIVFNVTVSGNNNKFVEFKKVEFKGLSD